MKKKWISLMTLLLMLIFLALPVSAKSSQILDIAIVMTNSEQVALADQIPDCGLDIVILTVPNLMGKPIESFADDFYENNRYGENGLIFLLDMGSRQWHISTSGTAIELLSDTDLSDIGDKVIPYFSNGRYYDGFSLFLNILPDYLNNESGTGFNILLSLVSGGVIAGITVAVMRSTMNTKRPQNSAGSYESEGSYHLRTHQDLFLYSNISKRAKPRNDSSSNVHRSTSGRSHGGRGGRF